MSNVDDDLEDRKNLLDVFATQEREATGREVTRTEQRGVGRRIWGAQLVVRDREPAKVLRALSQLAEAAGDEWYYRWPVNETYKDPETKQKKTRVKWVEGLTIKGANAVVREFGNCDVQIDEVEDLGSYWILYARFIDLQTGTSMSRPYRQRMGQKGIKTDAERSLDIAFQIGTSKAIRNIVTNALADYSRFALEQAQDSNIKKYEAKLPAYRDKLASRFEDLNFALARVEAVVGRKIGEWRAKDVARVMAMGASVADEMATWDELCPPVGQAVVGLADQEAGGGEGGEDGQAAKEADAKTAGAVQAGGTAALDTFAKAAAAAEAGADLKTGELPAAGAAPGSPKGASEAGPGATGQATAQSEQTGQGAPAPAQKQGEGGKPGAPAAGKEKAALEERKPEVAEEPLLAARRADPALMDAFDKGRAARAAGRSRRAALPGYSADQVNQWRAGFDAGEREPGEEG
jgi:hypothetical protein